MSSCVHGYTSKLDMARMENAVQMALCGLEVRAHFEWVPPDANVSDIASREERTQKGSLNGTMGTEVCT